MVCLQYQQSHHRYQSGSGRTGDRSIGGHWFDNNANQPETFRRLEKQTRGEQEDKVVQNSEQRRIENNRPHQARDEDQQHGNNNRSRNCRNHLCPDYLGKRLVLPTRCTDRFQATIGDSTDRNGERTPTVEHTFQFDTRRPTADTNDRRKHECQLCEETFTSRNKLMMHLKETSHGNQSPLNETQTTMFEKIKHLQEQTQRSQTRFMINKYQELFDTSKPSVIKTTIHHTIRTGNHYPIYHHHDAHRTPSEKSFDRKQERC